MVSVLLSVIRIISEFLYICRIGLGIFTWFSFLARKVDEPWCVHLFRHGNLGGRGELSGRWVSSCCQTLVDFSNPNYIIMSCKNSQVPIVYWSSPHIVIDWCIDINTHATISRIIARNCLQCADMCVPSLCSYVIEHQVCGRIYLLAWFHMCAHSQSRCTYKQVIPFFLLF